ncbi:MAG: type II toxin-antitoxin system VapC family toxin [Clostridiales bacterium]|nr:type II toxin-antitoxin system VapC family toxin [Clostridiales bacterium]
MKNRYLLDTHTFLWATGDESVAPKLSYLVRDTIEEPETELLVSAVTLYEITNKHRKGKLPKFGRIAENYMEALTGLDAIELPLTWEHTHLAGSMDLPNKDPFDRMLAAQAITEDLILITCDKAFEGAPGLTTLW